MDLIRIAIDRPIAVVAAVLMVVTFGLVALQVIPIQLAPDVRKPVVSVSTFWGGAAPAEVEREIVNRQEDKLKGLEGLVEMESRSEDSRGSITLEFNVDQNMNRALLLVGNRLDQVETYPDETDKPTLNTAGNDDSPIAWIVLKRRPGNTRNIHSYGDFVEDIIRDRLERVSGVARSNVYGGSEKEIRVIVDPELMARYRLTVPEIVETLRQANASISAGDVEEGKRRYVVRTEGELNSLDAVRSVILRSFEDPATGRVARVTVGDISRVRFDYKEPQAVIRHLGEPAIALNVTRETGANVIEVMKGVRATLAELNETVLPQHALEIKQVYDETIYIDSAISLVQQNIFVGGTLAALILLLFLRSGRATLVAGLAIPVSVIGSFVAMAALGRSLNVISLAGIAFAIGMVVDAAIVVLENIYRMRQEGKPSAEAAYKGTKQVWGAILVSALTTVLVFIPILIMKLEVGQLFRDIAVAISVAVLLSLLVAITVVPALANRLLGGEKGIFRTTIKLPVIDAFSRKFVSAILGYTRIVTHNNLLALGSVAAICGVAALATYLLLPKLEYLPEGNRNLVLGIILPPPGYNLDTTTDIAERIEGEVRPLWVSEIEPESESELDSGGPPKIDNFFFVALRAQTFLGAKSLDPSRVSELIPVISDAAFSEPGTFGFISQPSLFGRDIGSGRSIELNVSGPDLESILGVAVQAAGLIERHMPFAEGNQLRPRPGLELGAPEIRVTPDPVRLADNEMSATDLGLTVDAFNDGLRVVEVTVDGKRIDLTLIGPQDNVTETQGIGEIPVVTPGGKILPTSSLAEIEVTSGPTEIRHLERVRTVTLEIRPAPDLPLEAAMEIVRDKVMAPLENQGLPTGVEMGLSGTSDELTKTWDAIVLNLILAVIIVYLVMAVLFESFFYPFIILLSVPLATAGGVVGLALLNLMTFQPLDMLTLLGFVILVGIVVNNAILIVHQTLFHIRVEGMEVSDSITEATRNRIRPIFMSTLTSVFGMLPLVLFPGAGSELYRGLGSVVVGGLALSAILTLIIIPPLLTVFAAAAESAHLRGLEHGVGE
ncbi:MAG: efflux RND transporter permease subunit [Alphaproteobacteria bacterium]|nr:efflux RND transporter permease subunit [Alphaproteobacteria bacterium]